VICRVLLVCFSAFYAWRRGESHQEKPEDKAVFEKIKTIFWEHKRRYGARRIVAELADQSIKIGRQKTRKCMLAQQLQAIQPKSFVPKTTDSRHKMVRSPNLLLDRAKPQRPNEIWVGDITYVPLKSGKFIYLATWQDMFTRKVVGWELLPQMRTELVENALKKAVFARKPPLGLIIHSDGGGQYASKSFREMLKKHRFLSSMTRKNNHYDNAMGESLFGRFKAEMLENGIFDTFEDAYSEIFDYFEIYYNRKRRHSALGHQTPEHFEKNWYSNPNFEPVKIVPR
jgi:putative transposase